MHLEFLVLRIGFRKNDGTFLRHACIDDKRFGPLENGIDETSTWHRLSADNVIRLRFLHSLALMVHCIRESVEIEARLHLFSWSNSIRHYF